MSRIPLTDERHQLLKDLKKRSGIGCRSMISNWANKPPELTRPLLESWLGRHVKTVDAKLYSAVISRGENLEEVVVMTPEMVKALRTQKDRTGVGQSG